MKQRIIWIDALKAIAMMLVVMGHSWGCPKFLTAEIYTFHIPLFFFLSGMTLSARYSFSFYVVKLCKGILVPYILYTLVFTIALVYWQVDTCFHQENFLMSFLFNLSEYPGYCNYGLWFLPVLFVTKLLAYPVIRYCKNVYIVLIIMAVIAIMPQFLLHHSLVFCLHVVPAALVFVLLGYIVRTEELIGKVNNLYILLGGISVNAGAMVYGLRTNGNIDMVMGAYGKSLTIFYLGAISGILMMCALIRIMAKHLLWIVKFGRHTLRIYCTHYYVLWLLNAFVFPMFSYIIFGSNIFCRICVITALIVCYHYSCVVDNIKKACKCNWLDKKVSE